MEGYSLKKFFKSPFPVKVLPFLLLIFAFLGFLDATYLTISHYQHLAPPCTLGGCETVLTSSFATITGIPLGIFGMVFYGFIMMMTGVFLHIRSGKIATILFILCSLGLLAGIVLIGIQGLIIHSWCYYCLFSELIDFLLFDASWWIYSSSSSE